MNDSRFVQFPCEALEVPSVKEFLINNFPEALSAKPSKDLFLYDLPKEKADILLDSFKSNGIMALVHDNKDKEPSENDLLNYEDQREFLREALRIPKERREEYNSKGISLTDLIACVESGWDAEDLTKGYTPAVGGWEYDIPDALQIDRIDMLGYYDTLDEALEQAEKDGVKFINDMPGLEKGLYIDTPENRKICSQALEASPNLRIENILQAASPEYRDAYISKFGDPSLNSKSAKSNNNEIVWEHRHKASVQNGDESRPVNSEKRIKLAKALKKTFDYTLSETDKLRYYHNYADEKIVDIEIERSDGKFARVDSYDIRHGCFPYDHSDYTVR